MNIGSMELNRVESNKRDLSVDVHSKSKKNIHHEIMMKKKSSHSILA